MESNAFREEFCEFAANKLREQLGQIERCLAALDEAAVWSRANEHCNSVGNLVLHLTGNVRQWVLTALAGERFERDRAAEFAERGPLSGEALRMALADVVQRAADKIRQLDEGELARRHVIQDYDVGAVTVVFHVVEHFTLHAGQIVHMTKALRNSALSLYDERGRKLSGDDARP